MDSKYLEEIKARADAAAVHEYDGIDDFLYSKDVKALIAEVERLTEDNIVLKAELQDSHQDHIDDFMRLGTEIATLKRALELACEAFDYTPSGKTLMDLYIQQAQEQEERNEIHEKRNDERVPPVFG